jgi:transcriptional regulator with XRE-family HTH domain
MKRIPNSLKKYRKAAGLKQKEVAGLLGLKGSSMISRWEKGVCLPTLLNIFKLALLYRTMVDALFIDLRASLKEEIRKKR